MKAFFEWNPFISRGLTVLPKQKDLCSSPCFIDKRKGKGRRHTPGWQSSKAEPPGLRRRDRRRRHEVGMHQPGMHQPQSGDSERNKSQKRHFYRKTVANSFNKYRLREQNESPQPDSLYSYSCLSFSQALEIHIGTGPTMFKPDTPREGIILIRSVQFGSVAQSCPTLCEPMNLSMPGLPIYHQLPESTQTHVHWVGDAIQPSHPLLSPSPPALNFSQLQGLFQWVNYSHQVAKVLEFQLQHQSFRWTPRTDLL